MGPVLTFPTITSRRLLLRSRLFKIFECVVRFRDRDAILEQSLSICPESVIIIPIHNYSIILVDEYCPGIEGHTLKLPTGRICNNENVLEASNREIQEEIGMAASSLLYIGELLDEPGHSDATTSVVIAEQLRRSRLVGDEPEEMTTHHVAISDIDSLIFSGQLVHSRSIAALFHLQIYCRSAPI